MRIMAKGYDGGGGATIKQRYRCVYMCTTVHIKKGEGEYKFFFFPFFQLMEVLLSFRERERIGDQW